MHHWEFDSNSTSLRELHLKNQCPPNFPTFFGIQIDSRTFSKSIIVKSQMKTF
jgi:hypothetical protein